MNANELLVPGSNDPALVEALRTLREAMVELMEMLAARMPCERPPGPAPDLTAQELELVRRACDPSEPTWEAIALDMGLPAGTLHGLRRRVFRKLRVRTRPGMARVAVRLGLV